MRLFFASLIAFLAFGAFSTVSAKQKQTITVKINNETSARNGFSVKFVELVEDSRCPRDTTCIWEGNAKIKVRVTKGGKSEILELNSSLRNRPASFGGYYFRLTGLTPAPASNIRINRNGYVATIEIRKK
jgi:hypothetical protein